MGVISFRRLLILVVAFDLFPFGAGALIAVGDLDTPGNAYDVEVVGDLAYVAAGDAGLHITDFGPAYAVPEPGALLMLAVGLSVLVALRSVSRRAQEVRSPGITPLLSRWLRPAAGADAIVVPRRISRQR